MMATMTGRTWAIATAAVLGIAISTVVYVSSRKSRDCIPDGMRIVSSETFGPDNLSDKINGHADFYVASGLVRLTCTLFQGIENPSEQFEACDYEMGSFRQAFAVFSRQVREDADAFEDDLGYKVPDGASFFVVGSHYLEVIPIAAGGGVDTYVECLRRASINRMGDIPEARILPLDGRVPGSLKLLPQGVFGFDGLDGVVAARYRIDEEEASAFVSLRNDEAEARDMADRLVGFFLESGGELVGKTSDGGRIVRLLDAYEIVMTHGRLLAGVHDAPTKKVAEMLAAKFVMEE